MEQVEYLVTRNVGDLRWAVLQNLNESVGSFRGSLNENIQRTIETTRRALDFALRRRSEGTVAVAPEVVRLESAIADVQALRDRLAAC